MKTDNKMKELKITAIATREARSAAFIAYADSCLATDAAVSEDAYIDTASGDAYNAAIDAYNAAIDAYDAARKARDTAYAAIDSAKEAMNKVR